SEFAERDVRRLFDRELREGNVVFREQDGLNARLERELNCSIHALSSLLVSWLSMFPCIRQLCGVAAHPFHDRPYGNAAGPIRVPRLLLLVPRAARDIEVNPGSIARELLQKHRRRSRAAVAILAGVHDVGDLALDVVAIIVGAGKPPELLTRDG